MLVTHGHFDDMGDARQALTASSSRVRGIPCGPRLSGIISVRARSSGLGVIDDGEFHAPVRCEPRSQQPNP